MKAQNKSLHGTLKVAENKGKQKTGQVNLLMILEHEGKEVE